MSVPFRAGLPPLTLSRLVLTRQVGVHALESRQLGFHLLHSFEVGCRHAAVLGFPAVAGGIGYAVLATDVTDLQARNGLFENRVNPGFGES